MDLRAPLLRGRPAAGAAARPAAAAHRRSLQDEEAAGAGRLGAGAVRAAATAARAAFPSAARRQPRLRGAGAAAQGEAGVGAGRAGGAARRGARPQPGLREGRVGALHAQQLGQLRRGARCLPGTRSGGRHHRPLHLPPAPGRCRRRHRGLSGVRCPLPRRGLRVLGQQRGQELPAAGPAARPSRHRPAAGPRQLRLDPLHLRCGGSAQPRGAGGPVPRGGPGTAGSPPGSAQRVSGPAGSLPARGLRPSADPASSRFPVSRWEIPS